MIDRRDGHHYPGFQEAINNERDGLLENETWSYDCICSKGDWIKSKKKYHLGRLMTILSSKHAESPTLRPLKARIVFRGDQIVDQDNNIAVLQELKVNSSGITAINFNLASKRCCEGLHRATFQYCCGKGIAPGRANPSIAT